MTTLDRKISFSAADAIPVKLLLNDGVRRLDPVHVQWLPTNRCNLKCGFCSCGKRDRNLEMDLSQARQVIAEFAELGCKAATITGGGEPLCHPAISQIIQRFVERGIAVGLVTNGLLLDRLDGGTLSLVTWCRISNSDDREMTPRYRAVLERAVAKARIDWAFSHVVSPQPNLEEIRRLVEFANERGFTHVRLVADLLRPEEVDLGPVRDYLQDVDQTVIYQERSRPVPGTSCTIAYVKPLVAPDFRVYMCCGVQYALDRMSLNLPQELCVGTALDLQAIYGQERKPFDVKCKRCYYQHYNRVLEPLTREIVHREFV
jgi:MoaA/NifB/PqqE/SkfB family radical SAM enzyme